MVYRFKLYNGAYYPLGDYAGDVDNKGELRKLVESLTFPDDFTGYPMMLYYNGANKEFLCVLEGGDRFFYKTHPGISKYDLSLSFEENTGARGVADDEQDAEAPSDVSEDGVSDEVTAVSDNVSQGKIPDEGYTVNVPNGKQGAVAPDNERKYGMSDEEDKPGELDNKQNTDAPGGEPKDAVTGAGTLLGLPVSSFSFKRPSSPLAILSSSLSLCNLVNDYEDLNGEQKKNASDGVSGDDETNGEQSTAVSDDVSENESSNNESSLSD